MRYNNIIMRIEKNNFDDTKKLGKDKIMRKIVLILISVLFLVNCANEPELTKEEKVALKEAKIEIAKMRKNPTMAEKERILQKGKEVQKKYLRIGIVYFESVERDIPMADYYLARNYGARGQNDEALKWAKKGSDRGVKEASAFAGHIYANRGDEMNARKYYIKAMDQGDYREDTLFRVYVYGERKEIDSEVVEAFKRNLNKNLEVKNTLAFYYQRHDYFDEAVKLYKELVDKKYPNAEGHLGELYIMKKDYDKAEEWLLKESEKLFSHSEDNVKDIEVKRARLLRTLARVYKMKGDYSKAENYLLRAEKTVHKEVALIDLAKLYEEQGKYSEAMKINEELVKLKENGNVEKIKSKKK